MRAKWIDSTYGSGAMFYVGAPPALGSIKYVNGGYTGRGIFGFWEKPEPDQEHAKMLVAESVRATLQSQLKAINTLLGHERG